ncbi:MAG TPA: hypothetical protein PKC28_13520 [Bdellovibrionales bacterium]|nr:hypothetical protein [Bdellovibrionales bacterium]
MSSKLRAAGMWATIFWLAVLSAGILWRRWFTGQVPSQIDGGYVYLLLTVNLIYAGWLLRDLKSAAERVTLVGLSHE